MEHDFCYVTKAEYGPVKAELEELIHCVQDYIRDDYFTFSFTYVGSTHRRMITRDRNSNIGYDFDVNIHVNDEDENFSAAKIRHILINAFNRFVRQYDYDFCEDSTRVITIKKKNYITSKILHSCDFAIVYDCNDGRQQYIHFNKEQNAYCWEYLPLSDDEIEERADWLKNPKHNHWDEVKNLYIDKKNRNTDKFVKSRSIYRQTVNELYQRYCKN